MWITAPLSIPVAWVFRSIRIWTESRRPFRSEGILKNEELVEHLRLHERGAGLGGCVCDDVGAIARTLLMCQELTAAERARSWQGSTQIEAGRTVDDHLKDVMKKVGGPLE